MVSIFDTATKKTLFLCFLGIESYRLAWAKPALFYFKSWQCKNHPLILLKYNAINKSDNTTLFLEKTKGL
jgi:hypothetical protein